MTDMLRYQDVFQTINIPQTELELALTAKDLLDGVHDTWNDQPELHKHLSRIIDTSEVNQAFWDFENDAEAMYDRFAITVMGRGLTLAIEHRKFDASRETFRASMHIGNGQSAIYTAEHHNVTRPFNDQFVDTLANLGLYSRIQSLRQNESNEAILANAA